MRTRVRVHECAKGKSSGSTSSRRLRETSRNWSRKRPSLYAVVRVVVSRCAANFLRVDRDKLSTYCQLYRRSRRLSSIPVCSTVCSWRHRPTKWDDIDTMQAWTLVKWGKGRFHNASQRQIMGAGYHQNALRLAVIVINGKQWARGERYTLRLSAQSAVARRMRRVDSTRVRFIAAGCCGALSGPQ